MKNNNKPSPLTLTLTLNLVIRLIFFIRIVLVDSRTFFLLQFKVNYTLLFSVKFSI